MDGQDRLVSLFREGLSMPSLAVVQQAVEMAHAQGIDATTLVDAVMESPLNLRPKDLARTLHRVAPERVPRLMVVFTRHSVFAVLPPDAPLRPVVADAVLHLEQWMAGVVCDAQLQSVQAALELSLIHI